MAFAAINTGPDRLVDLDSVDAPNVDDHRNAVKVGFGAVALDQPDKSNLGLVVLRVQVGRVLGHGLVGDLRRGAARLRRQQHPAFFILDPADDAQALRIGRRGYVHGTAFKEPVLLIF